MAMLKTYHVHILIIIDEFKVRDTRLNPILKNTLFEMMSKDPSKRLELAEAKRRLSLQRYILSEGRAVGASSRISVSRQQ